MCVCVCARRPRFFLFTRRLSSFDKSLI
jgi:hypothetical protein